MAAEVYIDPEGRVRTIYSDDLVTTLAAVGPVEIRRASHVEPGVDGKWYADLDPVGGGVLGPFALRSEALAAEVAWLRDHGTPIPERGK